MHYVTERPSECTSIKTRDLATCILKDLVLSRELYSLVAARSSYILNQLLVASYS